MSQDRKVFIPNDGNHDYRAAERFGRLIFVTRGEVNKFNVGEHFRRWQTLLEDSTEDDYLLVTGLPILVSLGTAFFVHKHGGVRLLLFKFDKMKNRGEYLEKYVYMKGKGIDE